MYAASSREVAEGYLSQAFALGQLMASAGVGLVYGGGHSGLMGAVAQGVLQQGGEVTGVIPRFMVQEGWHHKGLTQLIETSDMHSRKQKMAELGDAVIALPGGCGTLEELLEVITWKQLGIYLKPIVMLNIEGFFNPLLQMLEQAVQEHFMREQHRAIWAVAASPSEAMRLVHSTPLWDCSVRKFAAI